MENVKGLYRPNAWVDAYFGRNRKTHARCKAIQGDLHCPLKKECRRYEVNPFHEKWVKPAWYFEDIIVKDEHGKVLKDKNGVKITRSVVKCDNLLI